LTTVSGCYVYTDNRSPFWYAIRNIQLTLTLGLYPVALPYTQGQDAVGTIVAHGPNVHSTTPAVNTRILTPAASAFAEYLAVPGWQTYPLPDSIKAEEGVAAATQGLTAISLVKEAYEVKKGDWVLVRAAAGGVGTLLVQVSAQH
jgi:NADPH2:quinone reductase